MAAMEEAPRMKRPLPPKVAAMKARKRRKLETVDEGLKGHHALKEKAAQTSVRLDDLDWRRVELPDRLDDFEGFFGLEEIDDVDVVRNGDNGSVSYELASKIKKEKNGRGNKSSKPAALQNQGATPAVPQAEEAEWSGLEDDIKAGDRQVADRNEAHNGVPGNSRTSNTAKADKELAGCTFTALEEEVLDDGLDVSAWKPLHLSQQCLSSLSRMKFARPTPIQQAAIPKILAGHDVIGKASTGSGKTLAFGIPIFEWFLERLRDRQTSYNSKSDGEDRAAPVALIISPTRELAHQITSHLHGLCATGKLDGPVIAAVTGGLSVQKQQRLLSKADIVIGTPGRLWEVMSDGHGLATWLKKIKFLVVDEADRVLSEGHFKEVEDILDALDREDQEEQGNARENRQTLVFSATLHKGLQQKLASRNKHATGQMENKESMEYLLKKLRFREQKPKFIDVDPVSQMASGLEEALIECAGTEKDLYLYALILHHPNLRTVVFTNSISSVRRLTPFLTNLNFQALPLHSNMPQKARLRSVERFSSQKGAVLVATDVAARGLDIPVVELIVHYHVPRTADMYVHRSGRTARAENSGTSVLLCGAEEVAGVRRLVAKVHATAQNGLGKQVGHYIRTVDIDRKVVSRLKPRATLAKGIADTVIAKEKTSTKDEFFKQAAEELGADYDSEEMDKLAPGRKGRGAGRKMRERQASAVTKAQIQRWKGELKSLLAQRINVGMSEKYLTGNGMDIAALLEGTGNQQFLGPVQDLGLVNV